MTTDPDLEEDGTTTGGDRVGDELSEDPGSDGCGCSDDPPAEPT